MPKKSEVSQEEKQILERVSQMGDTLRKSLNEEDCGCKQKLLEMEGRVNAQDQQLLAQSNTLQVMSYLWRRPLSGRPLGDSSDFGYAEGPTRMYHTFATHKMSEHIISANVAMELWEIVSTGYIKELNHKFTPKTIIEIGTGIGCATAFLAHAGKSAGIDGFMLKTIEAQSEFIVLARELIPAGLQQNIQFSIAPDDWVESVPWNEADMVVIDGQVELTNIVHMLKPGCVIFVEKRQPSVVKWRGAIQGIDWVQKPLWGRFIEPYTMVVPKQVDNATGSAVVTNGQVATKTFPPQGTPVAIGVVRQFTKKEQPKKVAKKAKKKAAKKPKK